MKHILEVLNAYIESAVKQLKYKDERIQELNDENRILEKENETLKRELINLSREHCKN
jgi:regulator of replication initiation timing